MRKLIILAAIAILAISCEKEQLDYNVEYVCGAMLDKNFNQVSKVADTGIFKMLPKRFLIENLDTSVFFIARKDGDSILFIAKKKCLNGHLYTDFNTAYIANKYRIVK